MADRAMRKLHTGSHPVYKMRSQCMLAAAVGQSNTLKVGTLGLAFFGLLHKLRRPCQSICPAPRQQNSLCRRISIWRHEFYWPHSILRVALNPTSCGIQSSAMEPFFLDKTDGFGDAVRVTIPNNITEKQLLSFGAFRDWKSALQKHLELQYTDKSHAHYHDPYKLRSITVQSVDWFGQRIGFVKLHARIHNTVSELPGIVALRGGSVAVLIILRPYDSIDERYVVMTEQPRIAASSLQFREIPAGMLDGRSHFVGQAANALYEEAGIRIPAEEFIDLTELALRDSQVREKSLRNAMYVSPGGSDESIPILLWEKASAEPIFY